VNDIELRGRMFGPAEKSKRHVKAVVGVPHGVQGACGFVNVRTRNPNACACLLALADYDAVILTGRLKVTTWLSAQGLPHAALCMVARDARPVEP
jgi:hypothetical protein